jgi:pimeloyl-ACP methyl ester carboxylesterase
LTGTVDRLGAERAREQSRARYPDLEGFVERDGVRVFYEVYGADRAGPTVLLLPTWSIIHSRHWKLQIPYLARHARVVTFDGRGNGRSDRPESGYDEREFAADALAVLDATGTKRATIVSLSLGAQRALLLAAEQPQRVEAAVFICPAVALGESPAARGTVSRWNERLESDEGWARHNRWYWLRDYRGFLEFFFSQMFTEPHSTKPIEDCVGWGLETTPEILIAVQLGEGLDAETTRDLCGRLRCPVLVIQGGDDAITGPSRGIALAEATGGRLVLLEGSGHGPHVRDPVKVNLLLRDLVAPPPPGRWARGRSRRRRALYVSSPIGLGHARRDVAIADELRKLHPDLEIDWLAQHPVTALLEARGERIHPASLELASESAHIERESAGHDLHAFQAIRRMDEILLSNFMVFHDLVRAEPYDLWIGDEAWDLDYHLHENPELKTAAYVWLTDFVGWLPMPDGGEAEARLTADYNAEMIEQIARYPRVRDRAIFVGEPADVVPEPFGPGLPAIREWTERHYDFAGYVTGFDPGEVADRGRLRRELGFRDGEQVCVVAVGGSGVGGHLLRRVADAFPAAKERLPALRMIVVCGPRIDPASLPAPAGLEVRPFVPDLYRHLAACDLALVQGGLTTTMELTASRRPFLYVPLRHHFEQNLHVRHRLERHRAGRRLDFDEAGPAELAEAIAQELGREVDYLPVDGGGAGRAAALIAELL